MFKRFFGRIHESVALSAILAASLSLHVAWIDNLLLIRSGLARTWFNLNPEIGPITGLYLDTLGAFFVFFFLLVAFWRGKDCSHWRERTFWFLIASIIFFCVMTVPVVYEFRVT